MFYLQKSKDYISLILLLALFIFDTIGLIFLGYFEVDWTSYMEQIKVYMSGDLDYLNYMSKNGPCVYGGAYIYIYSLIYKLTEQGESIFKAQVIYYVLFLVESYIVMKIYLLAIKRNDQSKTLDFNQCLHVLTLVTHLRLYKIFIQSLFNDCFQITFTYLAIYCLQKSKIVACLIFFSFAISIKMNTLLYLPALLLNLNYCFGIVKTLLSLAFLIVSQFLYGYEWITFNSNSYLSKTFEFSRSFDFTQSVNWQFISQEIFDNKFFQQLLLIIHLTLLLLFLILKWTDSLVSGRGVIAWFKEIRLNEIFTLNNQKRKLDPRYVALTMFSCNMIGIICARSLHYQYYSWYIQTIPLLLLYMKRIPLVVKALVMVPFEICWNLGAPRFDFSFIIFLGNIFFLFGCFFFIKYPKSPYAKEHVQFEKNELQEKKKQK